MSLLITTIIKDCLIFSVLNILKTQKLYYINIFQNIIHLNKNKWLTFNKRNSDHHSTINSFLLKKKNGRQISTVLLIHLNSIIAIV